MTTNKYFHKAIKVTDIWYNKIYIYLSVRSAAKALHYSDGALSIARKENRPLSGRYYIDYATPEELAEYLKAAANETGGH